MPPKTSPTPEQIEAFKKWCKETCFDGEDCQARRRMYRKRPLDDGRKVTWYLLYFNCGEKRKEIFGNAYTKRIDRQPSVPGN